MALNIEKELAVMNRMTVGELRTKWIEVFGERTNARNKRWLIKRIAWRMQANEEGDLSERARRRAMEIANDADLRLNPPKKIPEKSAPKPDHRLPMPGTLLTREYKGETIQVKVMAEGFEFEGEHFRSLSAVAKTITGTHWNGYHFFGLRKKGTTR